VDILKEDPYRGYQAQAALCHVSRPINLTCVADTLRGIRYAVLDVVNAWKEILPQDAPPQPPPVTQAYLNRGMYHRRYCNMIYQRNKRARRKRYHDWFHGQHAAGLMVTYPSKEEDRQLNRRPGKCDRRWVRREKSLGSTSQVRKSDNYTVTIKPAAGWRVRQTRASAPLAEREGFKARAQEGGPRDARGTGEVASSASPDCLQYERRHHGNCPKSNQS
jgi:hypothetical protein